jgi:hypothetical protein
MADHVLGLRVVAMDDVAQTECRRRLHVSDTTGRVPRHDEFRPPGQSLADHYTARGNPPGAWLGRGAHVLGMVGEPGSEARMRSLFGAGLHPNVEAMLAAGSPESSTRLGAAYPSYADGPRLRMPSCIQHNSLRYTDCDAGMRGPNPDPGSGGA